MLAWKKKLRKDLGSVRQQLPTEVLELPEDVEPKPKSEAKKQVAKGVAEDTAPLMSFDAHGCPIRNAALKAREDGFVVGAKVELLRDCSGNQKGSKGVIVEIHENKVLCRFGGRSQFRLGFAL